MIAKTIGFKALAGTKEESIHETLEGAQAAELTPIFDKGWMSLAEGFGPHHIAEVAVKNKEAILNILTTGPKSRPKARVLNGAKRTRKPKITAVAAPESQTQTA